MLTVKERQAYNFIIKYQEKYGKSPLLREVAVGMGISSKGVAHRYIKSLESAHMIARKPNKHRGLKAIDMIGKSRVLKLKSFGKIAAGGPIEAIPDKDIIELEHIFSNEKCYALKVQGDSMIDAGINDGDWVIVERQQKIVKSKVAVVLIDNQDVTLKYIKQLDKKIIELIPANKKLASKKYDNSRVTIQGIVIGQIRVY